MNPTKDKGKSIKIMDHMDIDHIVDVPDTPERLTKRIICEKSGVKVENSSPLRPRHSGQQKYCEEETKCWPKAYESGSKRLFRHIPKCTANSSGSRYLKETKGIIGESNSYQSHDDHTQHTHVKKSSCSSKISSYSGTPVDLTERIIHTPLLENAVPGMRGNNTTEFRKRPGLANGASCSEGPYKHSTIIGNAGERTDNTNRVGSGIGNGKGVEFVGNVQNRDSISSPRINKQKRLVAVRNGCISPNNIAKAKQLVGKDTSGSVATAHSTSTCTASNTPTGTLDIMDLVAEDDNSHKGKGKGVLYLPSSPKQMNAKNKHVLSRGSTSLGDKTKETDDDNVAVVKSTEGLNGWRSTHNRPTKINISSSDKEQFVGRAMNGPLCSGQHHTRMGRREKGIHVSTGHDCPEDPNIVSSGNASTQPLRQSDSNPRARLGRLRSTLVGKQKRASTASSFGDCSTSSVSNDAEVVFLSPAAETSNPRLTSSSGNNLPPIIEVDDFSPEPRHNALDEDARARQLEADELLARELQEQFYSEVPVFGAAEHNNDLDHAFPRSTHLVLDTRDLASSLRRQSQSRSSSNPPRRGAHSRASTLGRMTRLRSRFPGQPRTVLPSRGRNSLFPDNMDVDMRMHILGAMEAFSDMGVGPGMLHTQHDFNENDYEMLLALDDNNDQHGGASVRQINGLPQSTVQNDNFEDCAVCLESPAIGDTIRHLPCLHKFHKDCIDPWLRRKRSCPVCKSSIT